MNKFVRNTLTILTVWTAASFADEIPTVQLTYEVFSLPIREAAILKSDSQNGQKLYDLLIERLEGGKVIQEKFQVVSTDLLRLAESSEIEEFFYPTEYNLTDVLKIDGLTLLREWKPPPIPLHRGYPVYDTKLIGDSIEFEIHPARNGVVVDLNCKHISFLTWDVYGEGISTMPMPRFSVRALDVPVFCGFGTPALAGTLSPPPELQKKNSAKKIWLAFITITSNQKT